MLSIKPNWGEQAKMIVLLLMRNTTCGMARVDNGGYVLETRRECEGTAGGGGRLERKKRF
jgi:hypothetical protein